MDYQVSDSKNISQYFTVRDELSQFAISIVMLTIIILFQDIAAFLSGTVPVVYFSLGSVARGTTMPKRNYKMLLSVFGKLPYKVIWKFEDGIADLPENVLIRKWMPQQDILGKYRFLGSCKICEENFYQSIHCKFSVKVKIGY